MGGEKDGVFSVSLSASHESRAGCGSADRAQRRLIEEEDARRVQQAAGNFEAALHAAGEVLHVARRGGPIARIASAVARCAVPRSLRGTW